MNGEIQLTLAETLWQLGHDRPRAARWSSRRGPLTRGRAIDRGSTSPRASCPIIRWARTKLGPSLGATLGSERVQFGATLGLGRVLSWHGVRPSPLAGSNHHAAAVSSTL
jgi:hypothetical protein